eukprot:TRINITY_DN63484_c0_g1_i1.p1 TRINITY_DN63484_c0_g1~~TRINITY_DN63484_c0_g1_i1.p1  ORF type:complete len:539 (-),score=118.59 TRINITY_DN63484_c0_g1_i1:12-1517(-)
MAVPDVYRMDEDDDETDMPPPKRLLVGQSYKVVAKFVAIRAAPSSSAPFVRRLTLGAEVELFEWDRTRRWRRIVVETAKTFQKRKALPLSEAQHRWSTKRPEWNSAWGCWVDAPAKASEADLSDNSSDSDDGSVLMKTDAWVMIDHPEVGLLLEAVLSREFPGKVDEPKPTFAIASGTVEDTASQTAKTALQTCEAVQELCIEDKRKLAFDYFWGNLGGACPKSLTTSVWQHPTERESSKQVTTERVLPDPALRLGESKLMATVNACDYEAVRSMLQSSADPNEADVMGETPLFEASVSGQINIAALLLVSGADPAHSSTGGLSAIDVAKDGPTKALLSRWQGQDVNDNELLEALQQIDARDVVQAALRCSLNWEETKRKHFAISASNGNVASANDTDVSDSLGTTTFSSVKYRVVYKKVAVRSLPDLGAEALRQMQQGEVVEMFEWDASHCWRRVRIIAIQEGGMQETDGWMLIVSPMVGTLLEELAEGESCVGEDECAG